MTAVESSIAPGFADPVLGSQEAFRTLMTAMAEPGLRHRMPRLPQPVPGLPAAAATLLLTLADFETPLWLPPDLAHGPVGAFVRFHCGAPRAAAPADAAFVVVRGTDAAPLVADLNPGTDAYPDRSATAIVLCTALEGGTPVNLSGPGIEHSCQIAPAGLRAGFWAEVQASNARYPLGVDFLLTAVDQVIGLPRTTAVEVL